MNDNIRQLPQCTICDAICSDSESVDSFIEFHNNTPIIGPILETGDVFGYQLNDQFYGRIVIEHDNFKPDARHNKKYSAFVYRYEKQEQIVFSTYGITISQNITNYHIKQFYELSIKEFTTFMKRVRTPLSKSESLVKHIEDQGNCFKIGKLN